MILAHRLPKTEAREISGLDPEALTLPGAPDLQQAGLDVVPSLAFAGLLLRCRAKRKAGAEALLNNLK